MSTVSFQNISESAADMSATEPFLKKEITVMTALGKIEKAQYTFRELARWPH